MELYEPEHVSSLVLMYLTLSNMAHYVILPSSSRQLSTTIELAFLLLYSNRPHIKECDDNFLRSRQKKFNYNLKTPYSYRTDPQLFSDLVTSHAFFTIGVLHRVNHRLAGCRNSILLLLLLQVLVLGFAQSKISSLKLKCILKIRYTGRNCLSRGLIDWTEENWWLFPFDPCCTRTMFH